MEDIWASYYVSSKKYKIIYSEPTVIQKRNKHNLTFDFQNEYIGYTKNLELIKLDCDKNLLFINGSIPGANKNIVYISRTNYESWCV